MTVPVWVWGLLAVLVLLGIQTVRLSGAQADVAKLKLSVSTYTAAAAKADTERVAKEAAQAAAVTKAEGERDKAQRDLVEYRNSHPLHVGVCHDPKGTPGSAGLPKTAGTGDRPAQTPGVLPVACTRDIGPDISAMSLEADTINVAFKSCRDKLDAVRAARAP